MRSCPRYLPRQPYLLLPQRRSLEATHSRLRCWPGSILFRPLSFPSCLLPRPKASDYYLRDPSSTLSWLHLRLWEVSGRFLALSAVIWSDLLEHLGAPLLLSQVFCYFM